MQFLNLIIDINKIFKIQPVQNILKYMALLFIFALQLESPQLK